MRRMADLLLLVVQWLLVLLGLYVAAAAVRTNYVIWQSIGTHPSIGADVDVGRRLLVGVVTGLCPMGLGLTLLYLRRKFLVVGRST